MRDTHAAVPENLPTSHAIDITMAGLQDGTFEANAPPPYQLHEYSKVSPVKKNKLKLDMHDAISLMQIYIGSLFW